MHFLGFQALIRLFHLLDHRTQPAAQGIACLICDLQHAGVAVLHSLDAVAIFVIQLTASTFIPR